jgi:AbiTii
VPWVDHNLLAEIERDAIDDKVSLIATLRKCTRIGVEGSSDKLRDWANLELNGYTDGDDLPEYRVIYAPMKIDAITVSHQIRGKQISNLELPEFARDLISERIELAAGISKIYGYTKNASSRSIKMVPPETGDLLQLWNYETRSIGRTIMAFYWDVSVSSIEGVREKIRTTLVRMVNEMRTTMPKDASAPSSEKAERAVNVVLNGGQGNQVTVTATQTHPGMSPNGEQKESAWGKTTAIGTVVLVLIGIISLYLAYLLLRQH